MGGKEGSRGYLYQAIAAVIESLSDKGWDKIYIEFPSENDKVDIALEENGVIVKVIQVKSTIDSFQKSNVASWIKALINDKAEANCVQLILIGACTSGVPELFESIKKYKSGTMDQKAKNSLSGFDCRVLDGVEISYKNLPFDVDSLRGLSRDSLHKYLSKRDEFVCFDKLGFIVDAMVNDQMLSSIIGDGIDRVNFEENLNNRLLFLSNEYKSDRISVGIQSFIRGAETLSADVDEYCDLRKYFDGRYLQGDYSWNEDIYTDLKNFVESKFNKSFKYQLFLETHSSISFSVGRLCDSKSGIDALPVQKSYTQGVALWDVDKSVEVNYDWDVSFVSVDSDALDTALVLNVTRNICDDVLAYLYDERIAVSKVINCTPKDKKASSILIKNGTQAFCLADSVYNAVARRTTAERRSILHIFASAPNGFMFFLGKVSRGFGKCILYEYDFEQKRSCSYSPSISFLD